MNYINKVTRFFAGIATPWKQNFIFFIMMYLLGCVTAWLTLPHHRNAHLYSNLYPELFFDISLLCITLWAVGKKIRLWLKALFYVLAYTVALVDVYCFVTYDTTLTPTVMMLLAETNSREAGEFLQTIFSVDVLFGKIGIILLLIIAHIVVSIIASKLKRFIKAWTTASALAGALCFCMLIISGISSYSNKQGVWRLLTADNIGEVEHILTEKNHGVMYQPVYRLAFSFYANSLTAQQIKKLKDAADKVKVDSCAFTSPNIVLIIGESFSRHHSQQYGYWQPTTPRQVALEKTGRLVKYTDVISPWNLTSFVFKLMFSTYTVGDKGEWCDYPLFPELFRAAGYHVTFLTNQFLPKAKEAVYDFSGGFFLNDPVLSKAQFDTRNHELHAFDEGLLTDYTSLSPNGSNTAAKDNRQIPELTIFHLAGQHVVYAQRSPKDRKKFKKEEYVKAKPHLNNRERKILADYHNAILYNDSVVTEIVKLFDDKDAIVIYVPDHGEECFEGDLHFYCRMHSAEITSRLAHAEFDIPFWIYCSPKYIKNHPEIYQQVVNARNRKYMTDALPHLLLYLGGIQSKDYKAEYNILSPEYKENRPRIMKATTDYDKLK